MAKANKAISDALTLTQHQQKLRQPMAGRLKSVPLFNNQPINNYEPNKNLFSGPSIGRALRLGSRPRNRGFRICTTPRIGQAWRLGGRPRNRSFCICTTQVLGNRKLQTNENAPLWFVLPGRFLFGCLLDWLDLIGKGIKSLKPFPGCRGAALWIDRGKLAGNFGRANRL